MNEPLFRFREKQRIINAIERVRYKMRQPPPPMPEGWEHLQPSTKSDLVLLETFISRLREIDAQGKRA